MDLRNYKGFVCDEDLLRLFEMFPLFQWHACKLVKLNACIAKYMTTIDDIFTFAPSHGPAVVILHV